MMTRRHILAMLAALAGTPALGLPMFREGSAHPFDRAWLEAEAQRLSQAPYAPLPEVPQGWQDLTYDEYRWMWFNPQRGLWMDEDRPFKVDFFHPGLYFPRPVEVNVVEDGEAQTLAFDVSLFETTDQFPDLPIDETMGYSGLRLRGPLERPDIFTEFAVFQGASYFRGIGTGMNYGLSARGLAINTAGPEGEEFPEFTRFWLEAPRPGDTTQVLHALLDGESCTGAYTFRITPGDVTLMEVEVALYPRVDLPHVGLAPLTSMFLYDQTNRAGHNDFRPAVHDSDGLMILNGGGELLLRPLKNPPELEVSSFVDRDPQGFGLVQRARDIADFEDFEAHYQDRPAVWITPGEGWGEGSVQLVEIPSELEIYDNIVAFWRPRGGLTAHVEHRFSYTMEWCLEPTRPKNVARVLNTAIGGNWNRSNTLVAIDFEPHQSLAGNPEDYARLIRTNRGEVSEGVLERNPGTGGLRLTFALDPGEHPSMELRAQLLQEGEAMSEVWLYRWSA
ncbi:glucan biosynthesis protein [Gymnodinialimonas mytili]|uniref:glucan biosynthesis protein n=1 Tax=Gymnodinialimonas mytili TaxID=3126503 RepID=UPI003F72CCB8